MLGISLSKTSGRGEKHPIQLLVSNCYVTCSNMAAILWHIFKILSMSTKSLTYWQLISFFPVLFFFSVFFLLFYVQFLFY